MKCDWKSLNALQRVTKRRIEISDLWLDKVFDKKKGRKKTGISFSILTSGVMSPFLFLISFYLFYFLFLWLNEIHFWKVQALHRSIVLIIDRHITPLRCVMLAWSSLKLFPLIFDWIWWIDLNLGVYGQVWNMNLPQTAFIKSGWGRRDSITQKARKQLPC